MRLGTAVSDPAVQGFSFHVWAAGPREALRPSWFKHRLKIIYAFRESCISPLFAEGATGEVGLSVEKW